MNRRQRTRSQVQDNIVLPPSNNALQGNVSDGFQNLVLKLGAGSTTMQGTYGQGWLTRNYPLLDNMYRGSWIVGQAVDALAEDMTRAGINISGVEPDEEKVLQRKMTSMGLWDALTLNLKWGRLYGGSLAVMMVDGQDLSTPLDPERVSKGQFSGLKIFDRWSLNANSSYKIREGQDIGLPEYYQVPRLALTIHHSRCIRCVGVQLPFNEAEREEFWGMSIVERLYDRLLPYDTATAGAAQLLSKAHLRTVSVDGLREILAQGGVAEQNLIKMFSLMSTLQSTEGITLLDKLDLFDAHSYTFAGVGDIINQFAQQISGATGIPLARLLGQSPAGLGATGAADMEIYRDNIAQKQESQLRIGLQRLLDVVHVSEFGALPEKDFDFVFNPLKQMDEEQRSTTAEKLTKTVVLAYESDLIDRPTAMKELQQIGTITGVFNNIEDGAVEEAESLVLEEKNNPPEIEKTELDKNGKPKTPLLQQ
jgi:uncharacterized protein